MTESLAQRMLLKVIDKFYNDQIGWNENALLDGEEYKAWTEEELIEYITDSILSEKDYLEMENTWDVLEAKHIRFLSKERIRLIVTGVVIRRHAEEGKWEWEKEYAKSKIN